MVTMVPRKWDIVKLQIEPHIGKEIGGHDQLSINRLKSITALQFLNYCQQERRPVLVLSNSAFNRFGVIECMPIMSHNHMKGAFKQMVIPLKTVHSRAHGYIVPLQVLAYDYQQRRNKRIDILSDQCKSQVKMYFRSIFSEESNK